ncbi:MAG TPA: aldo/keto reductase [Isosphaeraceae bacterium]|nr:aldo/keto reductase [Isosphaeraceae bacterium]
MHDRQDLETQINRRGFLETGAGALAVATAASLGDGREAAAQTASKTKQSAALLPKRILGRTGVEVSMLNLGTWRSTGLDRVLRFAWANGIRYIDTARSYGSEPAIGRWLQAMPEVRKQLFLVTKDTPTTPKQLIKQLDERLAALQTDYVDLIFIHAVGDHKFNVEVEWPKSKEFKETAEAIRKSGKARFVGFSTHHKFRAQILQAAADGGFVDAIMLQNNPWIAQEIGQEVEINRALDACHKAGIGLISMKQVAGNVNLDEIGRRLPGLKEKGLSPYQGLLHAIWTDERFASCCVSMRNTVQVRENAEALRMFKPMAKAEIDQLRDACIAAGPTLCANCDGRCSQAANTSAELGNLTRFLTYHDHHGYRGEARRLYAELSDAARNWTGADLEAARQACPNKLDFAKLLPRADQVLG